jgi:hypothetical protein
VNDSLGGIPTVAVHIAHQSRQADQFDALNATRKSGSQINTYDGLPLNRERLAKSPRIRSAPEPLVGCSGCSTCPRDECPEFSSQRVLPESQEPHRRDEDYVASEICWASEVQPDHSLNLRESAI